MSRPEETTQTKDRYGRSALVTSGAGNAVANGAVDGVARPSQHSSSTVIDVIPLSTKFPSTNGHANGVFSNNDPIPTKNYADRARR